MGLHFKSEDCFLCGNSRKKYFKLADGAICPDCKKPLEAGLRFVPGRSWNKHMTTQEVRAIRDLHARQAEYEAVFAPDYIQGAFRADNTNGLFRTEEDKLIFPLDRITGYAECYLYSESTDSDDNTTITYDGSCLWIALEGLPSVWCRWSPPVKKKLLERTKTAKARWLEAMSPVMTYLRGVTGKEPSPATSITY